MKTAEIELFKIFSERFNKAEAENVIEAIKEINSFNTNELATKSDLANLATKEQLANLATKKELANLATKEELAVVKAAVTNLATKEELAVVKAAVTNLATKEELAKMGTEIVASKADLIKWMFIFWVAQLAALAGIIFTFLKFVE